MATFSCEDSSSLRSFRICCKGNRDTKLRRQKRAVWEGDAVRGVNKQTGCAPYLRLHPLLSLKKGAEKERERERREAVTVRGGSPGPWRAGGVESVTQKREEAETVLAPACRRTGPDVLLGFS